MGSNRKARRTAKAFMRRGERKGEVGYGKHAMNGNKFRFTYVNWFVRIAKEMKDNPTVIDNVASGRLDRVMGFVK